MLEKCKEFDFLKLQEQIPHFDVKTLSELTEIIVQTASVIHACNLNRHKILCWLHYKMTNRVCTYGLVYLLSYLVNILVLGIDLQRIHNLKYFHYWKVGVTNCFHITRHSVPIFACSFNSNLNIPGDFLLIRIKTRHKPNFFHYITIAKYMLFYFS